MTDLLRVRPAGTSAMLAVFDDAAVIRHALAFEAALARAQANEGLIKPRVAGEIDDACATLQVNPAELAEEASLAGTLAIPLVARLREALSEEAARAVHMGATSQDVADTVLMMQVAAATALLLPDLDRLVAALRRSAAFHAATPAMGRTLLQDALPISFGLRIAQWLAGIDAARRRLRADVAEHARIQFGGATGTRVGLAGAGASITARMAADLGLAKSEPWHARRFGIAAIGSSAAIMIATLGKMARDVSLLSQNAVGEAREPLIEGRGGSSAMAHKRNPTGCQVALSAATRSPGLVASLLAGVPQEEERGLGGWQAEGPVITDLFVLASGAALAMADAAEGLAIDEVAISRNLDRAGLGADVGESAAIVQALLTECGRP